jgi:hypothetical protein
VFDRAVINAAIAVEGTPDDDIPGSAGTAA